MKLPIIRTITLTGIQHNGGIYLRTNEVSDILGIKQKYEFTSGIKESLGDIILKGESTEDFRTSSDDSRTTFISGKDLLRYLKSGTYIGHKMISEKRYELIKVLEGIV